MRPRAAPPLPRRSAAPLHALHSLNRADARARAPRPCAQLNYGQNDPAKVAAIKAVYAELELEKQYQEYEQRSYTELTALIHDQDLLPKALFGDMLKKIYKRVK
jgi:farnesyl diphosphate synthase